MSHTAQVENHAVQLCGMCTAENLPQSWVEARATDSTSLFPLIEAEGQMLLIPGQLIVPPDSHVTRWKISPTQSGGRRPNGGHTLACHHK